MEQAQEIWHRLPTSSDSADVQLAAGDALLTELAQAAQPLPLLRWYQMADPALILGSGQKLHEFDQAACQAAGVTLYRRSSGGTAVLSEPDQLMLDIALPAQHRLHRQDVTESYRWLGEVWAATLVRLGLPPERVHLIATPEARSDTQTLDTLTRRACYGGRSPYEVLVDGRKLVGLAQVRRRQGVLLQTGIYAHWSPQRLVQLFAMAPTEREELAARLATRVAGLSDVLPASQPPLFSLVMQAFEETLRSMQGVMLVDTAWSSAGLTAYAERLPRYAPLPLSLDEG